MNLREYLSQVNANTSNVVIHIKGDQPIAPGSTVEELSNKTVGVDTTSISLKALDSVEIAAHAFENPNVVDCIEASLHGNKTAVIIVQNTEGDNVSLTSENVVDREYNELVEDENIDKVTITIK